MVIWFCFFKRPDVFLCRLSYVGRQLGTYYTKYVWFMCVLILSPSITHRDGEDRGIGQGLVYPCKLNISCLFQETQHSYYNSINIMLVKQTLLKTNYLKLQVSSIESRGKDLSKNIHPFIFYLNASCLSQFHREFLQVLRKLVKNSPLIHPSLQTFAFIMHTRI